MGCRNAPSRPPRNSTGAAASSTTSVAKPMLRRRPSDAARIAPAVGAPSRDQGRPSSRRSMSWTSPAASSTTTPIATARPASTSRLIVASVRSSTSAAATSDSGMATARHEDGAPPQQEGGEREHHERPGDRQREGQVVDRAVDVARGPEDRGVHPDAAQPLAQLGDRRVDPARDVERAGARELLDDEHEAVPPLAALHDGVADQRLVVLDDVGDVAELEPAVVDRDLREVVRLAEGQHVPDAEALVGAVDEAPGPRGRGVEEGQWRHELRVAGRLDDLPQRDVAIAQARRIDLDLQLAVAVPPDGDVRHAREAHEARPDRPPGEDGELDRRQPVGRQADHHDPVRARHGLQHLRRLGDGRDRLRLRQALVDELAGPQDVRPALEGQHDGGQAGDRVRADGLHALDAVEQVLLERDRQQRLDLRRRQAEALRVHLDVRQRVLGQHVDGRLAELQDADDHDGRRDEHHEHAELQARGDDRPGHRGPSSRRAGGVPP